MRIPRKKHTLGENDEFVTLMRVAQEDNEIRNRLLAILVQPEFHRKSMLNTFIRDMKLQSAPSEFVSAIQFLLNDSVAERAIDLLKKK
jgi:hypothetical protein